MGNKRHRVSEVVRLQALYEAEREHNRQLQAQLIEVMRGQDSPAELVEAVLAGVKAIVAPDLSAPEANELFTPVEPARAELAKDPAFEIAPQDWEWSEAMRETLKREEAEDG